jgi:2-haloacid dehalogenase
MKPTLLTLDVFGTVVDWRGGLRRDLEALGVGLSDADFERVIDAQGIDEAGPFRSYREITAASLAKALGLAPGAADAVGAGVGRWPPYPDSAAALRRLMAVVPCVAMTNSDRAHGEQVQEALGFRLSDWVCAEDVRLYKPRAEFWRLVGERRGVEPGPHWWHASAYADYDLETTRRLGLTSVFVRRPHCRPGPADQVVPDLAALADLIA